jgi:hypothetical protein
MPIASVGKKQSVLKYFRPFVNVTDLMRNEFYGASFGDQDKPKQGLNGVEALELRLPEAGLSSWVQHHTAAKDNHVWQHTVQGPLGMHEQKL